MARFVVDRTRCVSSAQCFVVAPEIFDINDDGVPEKAEGTVPAELHEKAVRAAESCPMRAITIIED